MSIKKRLIPVMLTALFLMIGSAVSAYAAEESDSNTAGSGDVQTQEASASVSKTILAGAAGEEDAAQTSEEENASQDEEAEDAGTDTRLVSLGVFKTTGYCPCYQCSEGWGRHTCTGALASSNHTVAVDPRVIPYGSKLLINGTLYTAEDRGGGVHGNHIDIFYDTHAQTRQHGSRQAEVFLVI